MELLRHYDKVFYHHFKIQMLANEDVTFDAWPGAVIRNNLLFAADKIQVKETNRSLREQIDVFPLDEAHPLYKELKEGFPKGYVLTDFSHSDPPIYIRKNEVFSFALVLIGNFYDYRSYFLDAIQKMCKRGIGKPMTSFRLLDISENSLFPVFLSDCMKQEIGNESDVISVNFKTPAILFRFKEKKNKQISYQDKSNRFPGFYQLTRSAFSRLQKLYALYIDPGTNSFNFFEETQTESFLENAAKPILKSANIQYVSFPNTLKKEIKNEMPLAGYVGEQKYTGHFTEYLPLLKFMEKLGVGNDTVYGMGRYKIEDKIEQKHIFLFGGHDLEMMTIKLMIMSNPNILFFDKFLEQDNANLSAYKSILKKFGNDKNVNIYGIELHENVRDIPENYHRIDHHNEYNHHQPSSLEQVATLLGVELTPFEKLIAADDRGYIPEMQRQGASRHEIEQIRYADRAIRGVTDEDERKAQKAVENKTIEQGIVIVKTDIDRFSPICDRLFPYDNLLIYTEEEIGYDGKGINLLSNHFKLEIKEGKMFQSGGNDGHIYTAKGVYTADEILKIKDTIIQLLKK